MQLCPLHFTAAVANGRVNIGAQQGKSCHIFTCYSLKERPERQIYRPGMGKFSSQTIKREDGAGEAEDQDQGGGHGEGRGRGGRRGGARTFYKSGGGGT